METRYITEEYVKGILKRRESDTHKGDYGKVLIVAGSKPMTGAAILAARGALRAGSGLVYLCVPQKLFAIFQIAVPEAICIARETVKDFSIYDSIIFGPGLGMREEDLAFNADLLTRILRGYDGKLLIDADGLNIVSKFGMHRALKVSKADIVITPHMGEAARLLKEMPEERSEAADALSESTGAVAVVKGAGTIVRGKETYVNTTGNPGMATAGSGDVLSGIIASLAGQGYGAEEAARIGVFIHGLAGDISAEILGQWGIIASDMADNTAVALQKVIGE